MLMAEQGELNIVEPPSGNFFDRKTKEDLYKSIQDVYLYDNKPWVIGYSGGKDSTATVQAIWCAIKELDRAERSKEIYVISSDTYVETPVIVSHITDNLVAMNKAAKEQDLPFVAQKVSPKIDQTFWVNLIGRGYPAPTTKFRWCTDRMKIHPANDFIQAIASANGAAIVVLGARLGESTTRDQVLKASQMEGTVLREHSTLKCTFVYAPIQEFTTDDVWKYLTRVQNPWGLDNQTLFGLYRSASKEGECPLVVDTHTPSCGNSRFGCWVCTVVQADNSMEASIDNGEEWMLPLLDFRNELANHKNNKHENRQLRGRNGRVHTKNDGEGIPKTYKHEKQLGMLEDLLVLQKEIQATGPNPNEELIRIEELNEIRRLWRLERPSLGDPVPEIYKAVYGDERPIVWEHPDVAILSHNDEELLKTICEEEGVSWELPARLLNLERDLRGLANRNGLTESIRKIVSEDWLLEKKLLFDSERRKEVGDEVD
jgi:DNA sulfur modification protein DndC